MRRLPGSWFAAALMLASAGCFTAPAECGPNPCGACRAGCTPMDACVDGEWTCACDCPDCCAGPFADQCASCAADGGAGTLICVERDGACVQKCYCVR